MDITEIIKKSIKYPTSNIKLYLLFGVLIVLTNLKFFTGPTTQHKLLIVGIIFSLIAFISYLLVSGFDILVIKEGIKKSDELPKMNFTKQLINGAKSMIIAVIYFIIPLTISIIIAFLMNLPQKINELITASQTSILGTSSTNGTVTPINPTMLQSVPNADAILTSLGIFALIVILLVIIFGIFYTIGKCRLANDESMKSALNIPKVIEDFKKIGFVKFIATYIIMVIIIFAILFVCEFILGFIGILLTGISLESILTGMSLKTSYVIGFITFLLINPYVYLFQSQTLGLLYSDRE